MATSTIWNHLAAHGKPLADPRAMDAATNGSGSSSSTGDPNASISANDFLTLLVTEMKNQDPTNATDPNQYINQLVSVNSLEQLIQMNQSLAAAVYLLQQQGTSTGGSGGSGNGASGSGNAAGQLAPTALPTTQPGLGAQAFAPASGSPSQATTITSGNLGVPASNPAALRIAQALSGRDLR